MPELSREDLRRLARLGATRRLEELQQEEAAIRAAFPELFRGTARRRARSSGASSQSASAEKPQEETAATEQSRQRRRGMTAAGRRAVSERMKRYWAERRKASKRG